MFYKIQFRKIMKREIQDIEKDIERRLEMSSNLNDLEMAKKRNHKIMITDEAINKVPRVQYKEIPGNRI